MSNLQLPIGTGNQLLGFDAPLGPTIIKTNPQPVTNRFFVAQKGLVSYRPEFRENQHTEGLHGGRPKGAASHIGREMALEASGEWAADFDGWDGNKGAKRT